jgi:hypothetical protein
MLARRAEAGGSHFGIKINKTSRSGISISSSLSLAKSYESTSISHLSKGGRFTGTLTSAIKQSPAVECTSNSNSQYFFQNLTFRGPCIVMYSYNESQRDALFLKFM